MTMTASEFKSAGDPETNFAGFGPFFLPGIVLGLCMLIAEVRPVGDNQTTCNVAGEIPGEVERACV
jgi:hypothetical protein